MFHYKLLIGLTIITIGLTNPITNILSNEPARCCFPKQYSSKTSLSSEYTSPDGSSFISSMLYDYARDESRGLIAMKGIAKIIPYDQESNFWTVYDLKNGLMYTIMPELDYCGQSAYQNTDDACIPKTARYVNSSIYEYNGKQILGDTWLTETDDIINYQTFSRDECIPMKTTFFAISAAMNGSSISTDFVESIVDPTIFDIPTECY